MNRFAERSKQTELIDQPNLPFSDWAVCLKELNTINTWLGGHKITTEGVKNLIGDSTGPLTIAEIGCGGGDNLKAIDRWNNGRRKIHYCGIDINEACTDFASTNCESLSSKNFFCSDYQKVEFGKEKPDIIFNSLFCHHFSNFELVEMLAWMKQNSRLGFFINDLQRHPLAYYSIQWLTAGFSNSYLVKNDGPVSVLRGFSKKEWKILLGAAGIQNYSIDWRWAFRYLVAVKND